MMEQKVTRIYQCELRALENEDYGTYVEGTPIVFSAEADLGYFKEIIDQGALDNTDLRDVPLFVNHNMDMIPLARSRRNNANSTMQLSPNENGMDFRANLDIENNSTAKELYSAITRGDIDKMSFAFTVAEDHYDRASHTRVIERIAKVYDISPVSFPANPGTELSARDWFDGVIELEKAERLERERQEQEKRKLQLKIRIGGYLNGDH